MKGPHFQVNATRSNFTLPFSCSSLQYSGNFSKHLLIRSRSKLQECTQKPQLGVQPAQEILSHSLHLPPVQSHLLHASPRGKPIKLAKRRYRRISISGTTFSGKKFLSGKVICAFFCPAYRSSPVYICSWCKIRGVEGPKHAKQENVSHPQLLPLPQYSGTSSN
jgi:hypothetical protein